MKVKKIELKNYEVKKNIREKAFKIKLKDNIKKKEVKNIKLKIIYGNLSSVVQGCFNGPFFHGCFKDVSREICRCLHSNFRAKPNATIEVELGF